MILQDGTLLKLFRRKRLITSAAIWPYAQRFADNAKKLEKLGIPCPKIIHRPLSKWQRKRNYEHMVRDERDRAWLQASDALTPNN